MSGYARYCNESSRGSFRHSKFSEDFTFLVRSFLLFITISAKVPVFSIFFKKLHKHIDNSRKLPIQNKFPQLIPQIHKKTEISLIKRSKNSEMC